MKFFGVKYFMNYFVKYFWNISKISRWTMGAGCIVHCNKVSKPVKVSKGKYLLLCMNGIMYCLLTSYTLIMFLKVLSHFIVKIKNFVKHFKEGVLKYFKTSMKFLNISKWNISSCIPTYRVGQLKWSQLTYSVILPIKMHKRVIIQQCYFIKKTGSYSQKYYKRKG